jgi:hypothetical protein
MKLTVTQANLILEAVQKLRETIRDDLANRYDLNAERKLPPMKFDEWRRDVNFDNGILKVVPSPNFPGYVDIVIHPFKSSKVRNIFDGATLAPDNRRWGALAAACFHDVWYWSLKDLMKETGLSKKILRRFADNAFYSIMVAVGHRKTIARCYLYGIRIGFPVFEFLRLRGILLVVCLLTFAPGCGCAVFDVPEPGVDDGTFMDGAVELAQPEITPSALEGDGE